MPEPQDDGWRPKNAVSISVDRRDGRWRLVMDDLQRASKDPGVPVTTWQQRSFYTSATLPVELGQDPLEISERDLCKIGELVLLRLLALEPKADG